MRPFQRAAALLCVCALAASGCAGMNPDARAMLQEPASCENPQGDTQILEASRPSGGKRFAQGLQGIVPVTAVDGKPVGDGQPGTFAATLAQQFEQFCDRRSAATDAPEYNTL